MADQDRQHQQQQDANRRAEENRKAREEARKNVTKDIRENRKAQEEAARVVGEAQNKWKPTPTPEEIELAVRGFHVDEKEDDGSPKVENVEQQRERLAKEQRSMTPEQRVGYQTRASAPHAAPQVVDHKASEKK